jgi:hypothetical protein
VFEKELRKMSGYLLLLLLLILTIMISIVIVDVFAPFLLAVVKVSIIKKDGNFDFTYLKTTKGPRIERCLLEILEILVSNSSDDR